MGGLGSAHQTLVSVLQGAHHGCLVALFGGSVASVGDGRLALLQLLLVEGELDGVGSRLSSQVVHARLQALQRRGSISNKDTTSRRQTTFSYIALIGYFKPASFLKATCQCKKSN